MKVSKIFGVVLSLHLCVIAVIIIQSGCSTRQPPTKTYLQQETFDSQQQSDLDLVPSRDSVDADSTIDASNNADIDFDTSDTNSRVEPTRPSSNVDGENEEITSIADVNTIIDVAGPSYELYTIQKGDNLWAISRRKNVSLNDIYAANDLSEKSVLSIGQEIRIPVEGSTEVIQAQVADTYQPTAFNVATTNYKVSSGDTLTRIASELILLISTLVIPVSSDISVVEESSESIGLKSDPVSEVVVDEETVSSSNVEEEITVPTQDPVMLNVVSADATIEEESVIQEADTNEKADALFETAVEIPVVGSPVE